MYKAMKNRNVLIKAGIFEESVLKITVYESIL